MSCLGERLTALVDGELGHDERDQALAHLALCARCRAEAATLRSLKGRLRDLGDTPEPAADDLPTGDFLSRLSEIGKAAASAEPPPPGPSGHPARPVRSSTRPARPARSVRAAAFARPRDTRPAGHAPALARPRRRYLVVGAATLVLSLGTASYAAGGRQGALGHARVRPVRRRARDDVGRRAGDRADHRTAQRGARPATEPIRPGLRRAVTAATGPPAESARRRRRRRAIITGGIAGALVLVVALTGDPVSARRGRSDPGAVGLLRAAADAARRLPYEGQRVLTTRSRDRSATSRVTVVHNPGEGIRYRSTSGTFGYRPESAAGGSTGFTPETLGLLTRNYAVVQVADASMCDRPAHVVEARRPDGTTAGRFWLDAETGLMLHRELIDASGSPIVSTGFTKITFAPPAGTTGGDSGGDSGGGTTGGGSGGDSGGGTTGGGSGGGSGGGTAGGGSGGGSGDGTGGGTAGGDSGDAPARPLRRRGSNAVGVPEQRTHSGHIAPAAAEPLGDADLASLRGAGWPIPAALTGGLILHDARRHDGVLHLSYSDGLAAVSVFVQRGTLDEARMRGWERSTGQGRTVFRRVALRRWAVAAGGGFVYTVLTDGPSGAAESVVRELPGDSDSPWARIGRGVHRIAAMINPFG